MADNIDVRDAGGLTRTIRSTDNADVHTPHHVAEQAAHDALNLNANLQVGDADVGGGNPVPVSDAGGALTVDGAVDIGSALPAGDNNIGNVDVATLPELPAGDNNIGNVDVAAIDPAADPHAASTWLETDNQDNALATATKAAAGGQAHFVTHVSGSFSASAFGKLLVIKDDTTEIARFYVFDAFALSFPKPLVITTGNAASAELAASGAGGVVGAVNLFGYTI